MSDRFVMQQPLCGMPGIEVLNTDQADRFTDLSEESLEISKGMNCKLTWSHTHYHQQYHQINHTWCLPERKQQLWDWEKNLKTPASNPLLFSSAKDGNTIWLFFRTLSQIQLKLFPADVSSSQYYWTWRSKKIFIYLLLLLDTFLKLTFLFFKLVPGSLLPWHVLSSSSSSFLPHSYVRTCYLNSFHYCFV